MNQAGKTIRVTKHNITILNLDTVPAMVCDTADAGAENRTDREAERRQHLRPLSDPVRSEDRLSTGEDTRTGAVSTVPSIPQDARKRSKNREQN